MKRNKLSINKGSLSLLFAAVFCLSASSVVAETADEALMGKNRANARARMSEQLETQIDASATLQKSTAVYKAMVKGEHGQVPESVLAKAKCIAVLPEVMTGAVLVGGSRGVGVTSCRENNKWSPPAFVKMNALSFGAQVGGKSSDIILFILNEQGKSALKKGNLALGADASVVAGTFDRSFDTSTYGAVAYSRTEGAFAGASLSGGSITSDEPDTTAFYGEEVSYVTLLEGRFTTKENDEIDAFTSLLPR